MLKKISERLMILITLFLFVNSCKALEIRIGPGVAGQIHAIAYDIRYPDRVYVGADVSGVYKSENGGETWVPFNTGLCDDERGHAMYVDDLLVVSDPYADPQSRGIYAATRGGIYFRADDSIAWELMTDHHSYSTYNYDDYGDPQPNYTAVPIPFSCLVYDELNKVVYAGAGTARWHKNGESYYRKFYPSLPSITQFGDGPTDQYSLWSLNVDIGSSVQWVPLTSVESQSIGVVRGMDILSVEGEVELAVAGIDGVYLYNISAGSWDDLNLIAKSSEAEDYWPGNYWDIKFGSNNTIYLLQMSAGSGLLGTSVCYLENSGSWEVLGLNDDLLPENVKWVTRLDNPDFELTRLSIVQTEAGDEVYVAERNLYNTPVTIPLFAGFYQHKKCNGDGIWRHILHQEANQNNNSYHYMHISDCGDEVFDITDLSWLDNYYFGPTIPLSFNPNNSEEIIAWMYGNPYKSTNGGDNWHQIQSDQSGDGWKSRGINMMAVTDLAVDQNGLLVVASNDYGAFQSTDTSNEYFKWLNCERYPITNDIDRDLMIMTDIECFSDSIYATLGVSNDIDRHCQSKIVVYKDCPSGDGDPYDEIGYLLEDYYQQQAGVIAYWVKDIEIINEDLWFVAIKWRDVINGNNPQWYAEPIYSDIWKRENVGGDWVWTQWNAPLEISKRIEAIKHIPGTNKLVAVAGSNGKGSWGGILCFDIEDINGYEVWVDGHVVQGTPTNLQDACADARCLAVDEAGTVLYVGTRGVSYYEQSYRCITGTVLRLSGPFDETPDADDWEILANNANDSFNVIENNYHTEGTEWPWGGFDNEHARRMTDIRSLAIDRRDPRIVYAGFGSYPVHSSNGVWKYEAGAWTKLLGENSHPNRPVSALVIGSANPEVLYAGTTGGEGTYKIDLPVVEPITSFNRLVDKSDEIYNEGDGINYQGRPYTQVIYDFNNDSKMDIIYSQDGGNSVELYECVGDLRGGVPDMRRKDLEFLNIYNAKAIAVANIDNDVDDAGLGLVDVIITQPDQTHIFQHSGDYTGTVYSDVTSTVGFDLASVSDIWSASWGDYDKDGRVDLVLGRLDYDGTDPIGDSDNVTGLPNLVLRNISTPGDIKFEDVSAEILTSSYDSQTKTLFTSWQDIDGDNDLDLIIGDIGVTPGGSIPDGGNGCTLYLNNGDGTFSEDNEGRMDILSDNYCNGALSWTDYESDGDPDIVLAGLYSTSLFINDGNGCFSEEIDLLSGLEGSYSSVIPYDYSDDNLYDYFAVPHSASDKARLLHADNSSGEVTLNDVADSFELDIFGPIHSAAIGDMTYDGTIDLIIGDEIDYSASTVNGNIFYQNGNIYGGHEKLNSWYGVRLIGDGGTNKSGIGATITAVFDYSPNEVIIRNIDGGMGLAGQGVQVLYFAADESNNSSILPCKVIWPDGYVQYDNLSRRQITDVYDESGPGTADAFSAVAEVLPDMELDFVFQWITEYSSDPVLDKVFIESAPRAPPECWLDSTILSPGMINVDSSITPIAGGGFLHEMVWRSRPCLPGCSYSATAQSSTTARDGTLRSIFTTSNLIRISVCINNGD